MAAVLVRAGHGVLERKGQANEFPSHLYCPLRAGFMVPPTAGCEPRRGVGCLWWVPPKFNAPQPVEPITAALERLRRHRAGA